MKVHISEINVKSLGPLVEFRMKLGAINLIYGRNEQGKTHLVEFIIRALFKKPGFDPLRSLTCQGEVWVTGIDENPISFNINKKSKKLEDSLPPVDGGLPPSLARLLVVRAGELSLVRNEADGVNSAIMKEYLSNEGFLDKIKDQIKPTILNSNLGPTGEILGNNMGEIKNRIELRATLNILDGLSERLQEVYSGGNRALLKTKIDAARASFDLQARARQHKAWKLSEEILRLERELARLPQNVLEKLQSDLHQYNEKGIALADKQQRRQEKETTCAHYPWLVEAIDTYKNSGSQPVSRPGLILLILSAVGLLAAILFSFLRFPLGTLLSAVAAGIMGWIYLGKTKELISHAADLKERENILADYANRFGEKCDGLPGLEARRKKLEPESITAKLLEEEIKNETVPLENLKASIQARIVELAGRAIHPLNWDELLTQWKTRIEEMETKLHQLQIELAGLSISPTDYLSQDPGIEFDPTEYTRLNLKIIRLTDELTQETKTLDDLKGEVCRYTENNISVEWEDLIEKLKAKRNECARLYRAISAKITAGILVKQALETFRLQEEDHILKGLRDPEVSEPLRRLTGRYKQLDLEDGKIQVHDAFSTFPLADLSTGAQEQVLLALRIGFARKLMDKDALFLILDDAFQHSDWQRREYLVDEMIELARQGWQILYFTMDDHIRGLFESRVKPVFGDQYGYRDLSPIAE